MTNRSTTRLRAVAPDVNSPSFEFDYTDRDFKTLQLLAKEHAGIALAESRRQLVYARIVRRLRARGLSDVRAYCDLLRAGDKQELEHFIHSITTHVTRFFREPEQLEVLQRIATDEWNALPQSNVIRLWSAGCSSGEEAYSIAMLVASTVNVVASNRLQVHGTDVDRQSIAQASSGIYDFSAVSEVEPRYHRFFLRGTGRNRGLVRIVPAIAKLVSFQQANLNEAWPDRRYHAIFCRNVMIYFTPDQIHALLNRFANHLLPRGYLFIGHSENIGAARKTFESCGTNVFRLPPARAAK